MKRVPAIVLLILFAFLQGGAAWEQFDHHEVCAHGELVHATSNGHEESHGQVAHDHCNVFGCLRHVAPPAAPVALHVDPITSFEHDGILPFPLFFSSSPILSEAPKTSPPIA